MKKSISVLLASVLIMLSFAGCGSEHVQSAPTVTPTAAEETAEISEPILPTAGVQDSARGKKPALSEEDWETVFMLSELSLTVEGIDSVDVYFTYTDESIGITFITDKNVIASSLEAGDFTEFFDTALDVINDFAIAFDDCIAPSVKGSYHGGVFDYYNASVAIGAYSGQTARVSFYPYGQYEPVISK